MATFSAGWHSYSFKSMIRSRFNAKGDQTSRTPTTSVPPNASFQDGVATKDVSINDDTGLMVRIFLPACCIQPGKINEFGWMMKRLVTVPDWLPRLMSPDKGPIPALHPPQSAKITPDPVSASTSATSTSSSAGALSQNPFTLDESAEGRGDRSKENSHGAEANSDEFWQGVNGARASADGDGTEAEGKEKVKEANGGPPVTPKEYVGYMPKRDCPNNHRLPVIVQFHEGGFVSGSKDSPCNDILCKRLARVCNSIVIAVGYRLAPEHKCPSPYDDGYEVLKWLHRQAILGEVEEDMQQSSELQQYHQHQLQLKQHQQQAAGERSGDTSSEDQGSKEASLGPVKRGADGDEDSMSGSIGLGLIQEVADPWIAVHADISRCIILGSSSGGNIADQVTRRASTPQGVNDLSPLVLAGLVLLYPLFGGSMRTPSESRAKDAYFFDAPTCEMVFKMFLEAEDFNMDHPAVNPMLVEQLPPGMPPTLLVVADHDILTDRIIAYSVFLRNFGVEVQVNSYKDVIHGFATHVSMVNSPQAEACVEDIAMWVAKHVTKSVHSELSY